jgi:hypothetical protein
MNTFNVVRVSVVHTKKARGSLRRTALAVGAADASATTAMVG